MPSLFFFLITLLFMPLIHAEELPFHSLFALDLLCWKASDSGLEYGSKVVHTPENLMNRATTLSPSTSWDLGYRLTAAFQSLENKRDLYLRWTHFNSEASETCYASSPNSSIISRFSPVYLPQENQIIDAAVVNWKLRSNTVDLELGRELLITKHFSFRFFAGAKASWIHQDYIITEKGKGIIGEEGNPQSILFPLINYANKLESTFNGIGPRIGGIGSFLIGKGISLYTNGALNFLLGRVHTTYSGEICTESAPFPYIEIERKNSLVTLSDRSHAIRPVIDLEIGIMGKKEIRNVSLSWKIAWDHHLFFGINHLTSLIQKTIFVNTTPITELSLKKGKDTPLGMQGITFSIQCAF